MRYVRSLAITMAVAGSGLFYLSGEKLLAQEETVKTSVTDQVDTRDAVYAELKRIADENESHIGLIKRVVKVVKPTVVHIEAQHEPDSSNPARRPVEEAGSGVIVVSNSRFYILTNRHVIKHSKLEHVKIKLSDGRQLVPTQAWADQETDIAILSVNGTGLLPARLGDSSQLEIGEQVLAVGSPFGLSHSVSYGIISAKGRRDLQLGDDGVRFQDFLQTDAAINPGNSGGPLLNMRGEVIGINTAIASNSGAHEGIGFSIPINMVMVVAKQLLENGAVVRAYLGVKLDATFSESDAQRSGLQRPVGARITSITPRSPAEKAKLQVADVIVEYDGIKVEDDNHLINMVSLTPVGKTVGIHLIRDGQPMELRVEVGNRSEIDK